MGILHVDTCIAQMERIGVKARPISADAIVRRVQSLEPAFIAVSWIQTIEAGKIPISLDGVIDNIDTYNTTIGYTESKTLNQISKDAVVVFQYARRLLGSNAMLLSDLESVIQSNLSQPTIMGAFLELVIIIRDCVIETMSIASSYYFTALATADRTEQILDDGFYIVFGSVELLHFVFDDADDFVEQKVAYFTGQVAQRMRRLGTDATGVLNRTQFTEHWMYATLLEMSQKRVDPFDYSKEAILWCADVLSTHTSCGLVWTSNLMFDAAFLNDMFKDEFRNAQEFVAANASRLNNLYDVNEAAKYLDDGKNEDYTAATELASEMLQELEQLHEIQKTKDSKTWMLSKIMAATIAAEYPNGDLVEQYHKEMTGDDNIVRYQNHVRDLTSNLEYHIARRVYGFDNQGTIGATARIGNNSDMDETLEKIRKIRSEYLEVTKEINVNVEYISGVLEKDWIGTREEYEIILTQTKRDVEDIISENDDMRFDRVTSKVTDFIRRSIQNVQFHEVMSDKLAPATITLILLMKKHTDLKEQIFQLERSIKKAEQEIEEAKSDTTFWGKLLSFSIVSGIAGYLLYNGWGEALFLGASLKKEVVDDSTNWVPAMAHTTWSAAYRLGKYIPDAVKGFFNSVDLSNATPASVLEDVRTVTTFKFSSLPNALARLFEVGRQIAFGAAVTGPVFVVSYTGLAAAITTMLQAIVLRKRVKFRHIVLEQKEIFQNTAFEQYGQLKSALFDLAKANIGNAMGRFVSCFKASAVAYSGHPYLAAGQVMRDTIQSDMKSFMNSLLPADQQLTNSKNIFEAITAGNTTDALNEYKLLVNTFDPAIQRGMTTRLRELRLQRRQLLAIESGPVSSGAGGPLPNRVEFLDEEEEEEF